MLSVNHEQIDVIKTNADAFMALSNIAISGAERLSTLNLNAMRTLLEGCVAASTLMLESNGSTAPAKAKKALPDATRYAVAYFQNVQEIATEAQQEATKLMTSYFASQGNGSNPNLGWLKGVEAFENLANQMNTMTEVNRKAMADVTSKVASTTISHSAKRA